MNGIFSVAKAGENHEPASSWRIWEAVRELTRPEPLEVKRTSGSWRLTSWPSRVRRTSHSTESAPRS